MARWGFTSQAAAQAAANLITQLAARTLEARFGARRNPDTGLPQYPKPDGTHAGPYVVWDIPEQDGALWVIRKPDSHAVWDMDLQETPAMLAVAGGLDPDAIDFSVYGISDPAVPVTRKGQEWLYAALAINGLVPVELS